MIRGGRSYVSSPPAFSNDAKRLLVCSGNSVSVFSTATALQVTSLEAHSALITAVIVVPDTTKVLNFCWTASLDGTIRYWDFSVPELIKTIDIKLPIFSMVIPSLLRQPAEMSEKAVKVFAYLSVEDSQSKGLRGQIRKCNLTNSRLVGGLTLAETEQPKLITISSCGNFFGIRIKRKLHIWKVPSSDSERTVLKIILHHTKNLTAFAIHPTQRIVAAGDMTGRVLIWRGFGNRTFAVGNELGNRRSLKNEEERPGVRGDDDAESCTTWHWHPAKVNVLSFSSDGSYLYSGGKEGVLVVWQLDTGNKKFLPRIGSPLLYYTDSPDPSLSSISCADNQIHILKMPSMGILKSISGIKLPCSFPEICKGICNGVAFDQNNGLVALRTENYCIQFYSLFDDRGISEVQVCERNHQPGDEVTVVVTLVALSLDGSVMLTAEEKLAEEGLGGLVSLKFWTMGLVKKFTLSTIVYEPHRDAGISSVAFNPIRCMAVSSSYGGDFKVWVCNKGIEWKDLVLANSRWTCHAVASYKKKPMTAAAFSHDGSVLAVAAETFITLWDAYKNVLLAVVGESITPIGTLSFLGKSEYLVSASWGSKPQLSVWNMSKLCSSWSYRLHVEAVASATDLLSFAALVLLPESSKCSESDEAALRGRDGVILFFNATDPVPVATWLVNKAKGGALSFLNQSTTGENMFDGNAPKALLVYINGDHEYIIFNPYDKEFNELSTIKQDGHPAVEESGKFGYASIYGELPVIELKKSETPWVPSERPWETIFSGPSHNLPPLTKLCSAFLESLMEKRTAVAE
ncbi:Transducin/WD40 repeat-like superfamily protein [Euphorbia peplus]|nr:Transducin/WD40 repeat-like superfamily protein [Euphorbia peplus]